MKFTFFKLFFNSLVLLHDSLKHYKIIACYALILTFLGLVFGQNLSCAMGKNAWWCVVGSDTMALSLFLLSKILTLFVLFAFFADFYDTTFNGVAFSVKNMVILNRQKLKKIGVLFGLILLAVVSLAVVIAMVMKEPNPNWKIEFIYFLLAFVCVWIPFIEIRLAGAVDYFMTVGKFPSLKEIWQQTTDKAFSIIFAYGATFLLFNFITLQINLWLRYFLFKNFYFVTTVAVEYVANCFVCLYVLMLMMLMRSQSYFFASKNSSPSDEDTIIDSQKNDAELPTAEDNNSGVKKTAKKAKQPKHRKNKKEKK